MIAPVLIAVLPLTTSVVRPLMLSSLLLPSTALPMMVKALSLPINGPWVDTDVPVSTVSRVRVSAPP